MLIKLILNGWFNSILCCSTQPKYWISGLNMWLESFISSRLSMLTLTFNDPNCLLHHRYFAKSNEKFLVTLKNKQHNNLYVSMKTPAMIAFFFFINLLQFFNIFASTINITHHDMWYLLMHSVEISIYIPFQIDCCLISNAVEILFIPFFTHSPMIVSLLCILFDENGFVPFTFYWAFTPLLITLHYNCKKFWLSWYLIVKLGFIYDYIKRSANLMLHLRPNVIKAWITFWFFDFLTFWLIEMGQLLQKFETLTWSDTVHQPIVLIWM